MVTCGVAIGIVIGPNVSEYGNCYTNGHLSLISDPPSLWSISQLLTITLPFGSFTYTEVKLIDAAWDVVVGRCGQILVLLLLYRVLVKATLFTMEFTTVRGETFAATALSSGSTHATWAYMKDVYFSFRSSKTALANAVLMSLASVYPLVFPTIVSAMTGYQVTTSAYVAAADGTLFPADNLTGIEYVVHDADRIGYPAELNITSEMLAAGWINTTACKCFILTNGSRAAV